MDVTSRVGLRKKIEITYRKCRWTSQFTNFMSRNNVSSSFSDFTRPKIVAAVKSRKEAFVTHFSQCRVSITRPTRGLERRDGPLVGPYLVQYHAGTTLPSDRGKHKLRTHVRVHVCARSRNTISRIRYLRAERSTEIR